MRATLYDLQDRPIATIDNDEIHTIRLYNGYAVAHLVDDIIAGWNGNQLGQLVNGDVLNSAGIKVGSIKSKKFNLPPYQPLSDYIPPSRAFFPPGGKKIIPLNPISDPTSLEEVLRCGATLKIPPLKFPGEPPTPPAQP